MKPRTLATLAALGLLAGSLPAARAQVILPQQPGSPFNRPPVLSPYLNLALPGNPAINYFGLVRPQIDQRNALLQLQSQLAQQQTGLVSGEEVPVTGHAAQFLNHYGYFQNWRRGSGGVTSGGALGASGASFLGTQRSFTGGFGRSGLLGGTTGTLGVTGGMGR